MNSENSVKKIKGLLKNCSLTVQDLADRLGITVESLRDILDEREFPTTHILRRICKLFGLPEKYFGSALASDGQSEEEAEELPTNLLREFQASAHGPRTPAPRPSRGAPDPVTRAVHRSHRRRKLDLAEIAARFQALLDLLVDKQLITRDEFQMHLEIIRAKVIARKSTVAKSR